jgi:hypothetical protein
VTPLDLSNAVQRSQSCNAPKQRATMNVMTPQDVLILSGIACVWALALYLQRDTYKLLNTIAAKLEKEQELFARMNELLAQWQREKELESRATTEMRAVRDEERG